MKLNKFDKCIYGFLAIAFLPIAFPVAVILGWVVDRRRNDV